MTALSVTVRKNKLFQKRESECVFMNLGPYVNLIKKRPELITVPET